MYHLTIVLVPKFIHVIILCENTHHTNTHICILALSPTPAHTHTHHPTCPPTHTHTHPPQAQFSHMGTTKEYLQHLCYNQTLIDSYLFKTETAVRYLSREEGAEPAEKKPRAEKFENCAIICTRLNDRERSEFIHNKWSSWEVATLSFVCGLAFHSKSWFHCTVTVWLLELDPGCYLATSYVT